MVLLDLRFASLEREEAPSYRSGYLSSLEIGKKDGRLQAALAILSRLVGWLWLIAWSISY